VGQRLAGFAPIPEEETIPLLTLHGQEVRLAPLFPDRNYAGPHDQIQSHAEFDRYAKEYSDLLRNPVRDLFATNELFFHRRKWEILQDGLRARRFPMGQARWLDAGCGRGELLSFGERSFGVAVGCDTSAEMIGGRPGVFLQESPLELPFPDSCFDLVTTVCVYHHLEEQARQTFSAELFRVLRPGGLVCFMEHNPLNPVTKWIVSRTPVDANARLLTHFQMARLAGRAGFLKPEFRFFLFLPEKIHSRFSGLENLVGRVPLGGQYAAFCVRP
jgi:SAM-dependent methyltransferase